MVSASRSPPSTTTTTVAGTPLTTLLQKVAPQGTCAHRTLPMGTEIKVTRAHNGATAKCKVDDGGPRWRRAG